MCKRLKAVSNLAFIKARCGNSRLITTLTLLQIWVDKATSIKFLGFLTVKAAMHQLGIMVISTGDRLTQLRDKEPDLTTTSTKPRRILRV